MAEQVTLDELIGLIEGLRQKVQTYATELSQSEAQTRYALIDPLLQALGWDTADPAQVRAEYSVGGNRCDYLLLDSTIPIVLLEAKPLGSSLPSIATTAVVGYAMQLSREGRAPRLVGSTIGMLWELYDPFQLKQPRFQFDLRKGTAAEAALGLLTALWRSLLCTSSRCGREGEPEGFEAQAGCSSTQEAAPAGWNGTAFKVLEGFAGRGC